MWVWMRSSWEARAANRRREQRKAFREHPLMDKRARSARLAQEVEEEWEERVSERSRCRKPQGNRILQGHGPQNQASSNVWPKDCKEATKW